MRFSSGGSNPNDGKHGTTHGLTCTARASLHHTCSQFRPCLFEACLNCRSSPSRDGEIDLGAAADLCGQTLTAASTRGCTDG
eukprot:12156993-Alexandrium_andersonii.AAC.1